MNHISTWLELVTCRLTVSWSNEKLDSKNKMYTPLNWERFCEFCWVSWIIRWIGLWHNPKFWEHNLKGEKIEVCGVTRFCNIQERLCRSCFVWFFLFSHPVLALLSEEIYYFFLFVNIGHINQIMLNLCVMYSKLCFYLLCFRDFAWQISVQKNKQII